MPCSETPSQMAKIFTKWGECYKSMPCSETPSQMAKTFTKWDRWYESLSRSETPSQKAKTVTKWDEWFKTNFSDWAIQISVTEPSLQSQGRFQRGFWGFPNPLELRDCIYYTYIFLINCSHVRPPEGLVTFLGSAEQRRLDTNFLTSWNVNNVHTTALSPYKRRM